MGARKQYTSINFHGGLTEGISLILITNVHDFYTTTLIPIVELKADQRLIIQNISARRDVFVQRVQPVAWSIEFL